MRALTEPGFTAVVFSKTQKDSSDLCDRIKNMALSLGDRCPDFESESKTKLSWRGLGHLEFLPVTARAARSIPSVSVVLFDEAAFITGIEGVYQAAVPTLSMLGDKGKVIFNSTPNGRQGLFWKLLSSDGEESDRILNAIKEVRVGEPNQFLSSDSGWAKVLLHWRSHPIYAAVTDWANKQRTKLKLTLREWNMEYELDLQESGAGVFDPGLVDADAWGSWQPPTLGQSYLMGIDPSFGSGDYFTCQVWDVTLTPYQLVAQYRENHKTKDYNLANVIQLIDAYHPALISCEVNSGGQLILEELNTTRPGFTYEKVITTNQSKLLHTDRLVLLLERGMLGFPADSHLPDELKGFIEILSGSTRLRQAESGKHDDTVMAAAVAFAHLEKVISASWLDALTQD